VSSAPARPTATLRVARGSTGSVVTRASAQSPLALRTPDNHGHAAWVFTSSHGGGLVSGDDVRLEATVEEGATLVLATQASTKAYRQRSRAGDGPTASGAIETSQLRTNVKVERGALACLLPDPLVAFQAARLVQATHVTLADEASLVLWDPVGAGRVSRGERWAFELLETRIHLDGPRGRILTEASRLCPADTRAFAERFAFEAFGVLVVIGPRVERLATRILERSRQEAARSGDTIVAVSPLADGALVRAAATSTSNLTKRLRLWLDELPTLLGDDFLARRAF
jgi:urease accessory protein